MISILVPTSGRPAMFRNMLESLVKTAHGYELEICAVIDADPQALEIAEKYRLRIDYSPVRRGALWGWNRALQISIGDILVPAGDDQIFHEDWLTYALESHRSHCKGYGVVGMNDLAYKPPQVATMWLFDRKYCKDVMGGVFAPPMYTYLCVDLEWNEKAQMLGHFYWDERSKVEHLHSAHGKRPYDDLDRWKDESNLVVTDTAIYEDRKSRGFPIEWESLI